MGRSSKSTINDIIKLIECDHILAFIGLGAAAGCHGNCVFHIAPQVWFICIKRREGKMMNPQNDLALQGFGELFSLETHPFGLFHPLFLSQGCSSAFPFVSQEASALLPTSPLLQLGWVKAGAMEKGNREKRGLSCWCSASVGHEKEKLPESYLRGEREAGQGRHCPGPPKAGQRGRESRGCSLHPPQPVPAERVQSGLYLQIQSNAKGEKTDRDYLLLAAVSVLSLAGCCGLQVHLGWSASHLGPSSQLAPAQKSGD